MFKNILIVDDVKEQAEGMAKWFQKRFGDSYSFDYAYEKEKIELKIDDGFYSLVILDLRLDGFGFSGIDLANRVIKNNPLAKIIFISAFSSEFFQETKDLLLTGRVLDIQEKSAVSTWYPILGDIIEEYYLNIDDDISEINKSLLEHYSDIKNEEDSYQKGIKLERFTTHLFGLMGFQNILKRVKDKSCNEVDLIIRNDIDDLFISKFGKYILVECKNYPSDNIGKNELIQFKSKLDHTNGLASLGLFITTKAMAKTAYMEAIRYSVGDKKIIFIENSHIINLIQSDQKLNEFKKIIDSQVKDN